MKETQMWKILKRRRNYFVIETTTLSNWTTKSIIMTAIHYYLVRNILQNILGIPEQIKEEKFALISSFFGHFPLD